MAAARPLRGGGVPESTSAGSGRARRRAAPAAVGRQAEAGRASRRPGRAGAKMRPTGAGRSGPVTPARGGGRRGRGRRPRAHPGRGGSGSRRFRRRVRRWL